MRKILLVIIILLYALPGYACTSNGIYPDLSVGCTPTSTYAVTKEQICVKGYSLTVRKTTKAMKDKVYELYGIPKDKRKDYVLDHVISLQLGGRDDIDNLFPQKRGGVINSKTKDRIENWLKRSVCDGDMTLKEAQQAIKEDWLSLLENYLERND
jgi:hypothetical protein